MLGHLWRILISAGFQLRLLKAFVASTWRMAWHDGNSITLLTAWMATSILSAGPHIAAALLQPSGHRL